MLVKYKWYLVGLIFLGLGFGVIRYGANKYEAGYNAAKVEQAEAFTQQLQEQNEQLKERYNTALAKRDKANQEALALVEQLRKKKPEVITREITKYVKTANCTDLGNDFARLFNTIHDAKSDRNSRPSDRENRE